jgi:Cytotoxic
VPPLPDNCFLREQDYLGFKHGARRWRNPDHDRIYEWDDRHQHIEAYNNRGVHVGVLHGVTGVKIADPVKGRKIDV